MFGRRGAVRSALCAGGVALLAALVAAPGLCAVDPRLIPVGATWRYLVVDEDSPAPEPEWRQADFDDSTWAEGRSGFSLAGDEVTGLQAVNPTAALFRGRFVVEDPADVRWLVLRADYVSGFVAYLNGREIARRGLVGDPPPYDAVAAWHARYATEELDLSAHRDALRAGTNVLAIQLHAAETPAISMVLVPELCANFQRGPFLQNARGDGMDILWRTPVPADTTVEYGQTPALGLTWSEPTLTTNHIATLTGLSPDTLYFYRVRSAAATNAAVSPIWQFRTLRATGEVAFAVLGDSGSGWLSQFQVASCVATSGVDVVLHVGDITYPYLSRGLVDTRCLSVYGEAMRGRPFFFTPGNHEFYADPLTTYLETFRMPTNTATGTPHFYSFDHGDAHFVSLFVPTLMNYSGTAAYALRPGGAQLEWLTNDLAATMRPWRIVFLHSPLFSSGGHRFDDWNYNGAADRLELQSWLLPVLEQFGVQAVFSGHDHSYERFASTNGVHCFISGGGGYTLYALTQRDPLSERFERTYHSLRARISGETMLVEAVDRFGAVFDRVTIPRVSPPTLRLRPAADRQMRLVWNAAPGFTYDVEVAATPAGPFASLVHTGLPYQATTYLGAFDLGEDATSSNARFFRLRVLR